MSDNVVKIDDELLSKVRKLIKDKSKRIRYRSARQFVDIAVLDLINKEEKQVSKNDE